MTPTREETMPTPVPVPTREEIVKLLRDVVWALTDDARSHAERGLVKQRVIRTADALDAAPVLTFDGRVEKVAEALMTIDRFELAREGYTDKRVAEIMDRYRAHARLALRAAGVEE